MTTSQNKLHAHVLRQLKRSGIEAGVTPPSSSQWSIFLERVSLSYTEADNDRYLNDRAWELSSSEMQQLYAQLAETSASALAIERDRLTTVFNAADTGLCLLDSEHHIVELNSAGAAFLGVGRDAAIGRSVLTMLWPVGSRASHHHAPADLRIAMTSGHSWQAELVKLRVSDDRTLTCSITFNPLNGSEDAPEGTNTGGVAGIGGVLAFHDVTELHQAEEDLAWRATHDPLTGLLNRAAFNRYVDSALCLTERSLDSSAVLFIDLDRFKNINDTMGHDAGDTTLVEAASRIRGSVRTEDVVARLGGDEFVVFLEHVTGPIGAQVVADRLLSAMRRPFRVGDQNMFLSASIGIAISASNDTAGSMLRDADIALYAAKGNGRDRAAAFGHQLRETMDLRVQLDRKLRSAVDGGELAVAYQPIVSLIDERVVGYEALARWPGVAGPDVFIPLAEENGMILRIGEFVIAQALEFAVGLPHGQLAHGPADPGIAVNVSGVQLAHGGFADFVKHQLQVSGLDPHHLTIELTESTLLSNRDLVLRELSALADIGVGIALDDFGTGWSSLSLLQQFPISAIKIDRSFVAGMCTNKDDLAIVQAVIQLGQALGHSVIAEGVETPEHAELLRELGATTVQGYLFGRPEIPATALTAPAVAS